MQNYIILLLNCTYGRTNQLLSSNFFQITRKLIEIDKNLMKKCSDLNQQSDMYLLILLHLEDKYNLCSIEEKITSFKFFFQFSLE
ncbi:hypothetical protein BpHYR1_026607 [Brachionus plicatilis]|uniref:Uncharacterized protein n=1 Tax=Brachionus plicatilis TaxID=10195 RepID=A0A3M7Q6B5_BRAPC|nr:hypothetical protein BpHYR1_026607 [Brachionus plicatilis]